ncbi:dTDP-4-dehydrorhamnose reductase [Bradyrhizobium sp.]|uniref:dTDP-4-dehydrorhamnose reductase n=1 Tax=Bradyrhizobium sp. TaxID=376 RepID=UPI003C1761CB
MRLFVVGRDGQVASSLRELATSEPNFVIDCRGRPDVDLLRPDSIERALSAFSPDLVINPAAYTAVDRAESEAELAFATNSDGAGNVAAAAAQIGVPVIHLSTDYVFDGKKNAPYIETDPVGPLGVYGESKLAGERAVATANERHIILRTSWVYAPFGNNFVRTMLRLSRERDKLSVVDDQVGCPTSAPDLAFAILEIARKALSNGWNEKMAGTTHICGPDEVSWCAFARKIMDVSRLKCGHSVEVEAIRSADHPTRAARPANSRLCCDRLATTFDIRMPPLKSSLERCVDSILNQNQSQ